MLGSGFRTAGAEAAGGCGGILPVYHGEKSTALIKKLGHLTSTAQAEQLNRRIYMGGTPKPENESIYYNVDTIHNAVQKKQQITFQYFEYTPKKEKVLKHDGYKYRFSPYAMIWNRTATMP